MAASGDRNLMDDLNGSLMRTEFGHMFRQFIIYTKCGVLFDIKSITELG